MTVDMTETCCH